MLNLIKYLDARLSESGTWSSIAAALVALHVSLAPGLWDQVVTWGIAIAVALGVLLKEAGTGLTFSKVAGDTLAAAADSIQTSKMVMLLLLIPMLMALWACGTTPQQQAQLIHEGAALAVDLAQVAAKNNQTVQTVLNEGALICGQASSTNGQLVEGTAVAVLNSAGVPVSVTNQTKADVAAACPANLVPGPAPSGQTSIPTAAVQTSLPPVTS